MTWLDWLGAAFCAAAAVAFLTWAANSLYETWPRMPDTRPTPPRSRRQEPRSPMQMYLDGNGDLSNPRVAALLAEAERGWNRNQRRNAEDAPQESKPARGDYDSIGNDAALLCSGIVVAPDACITMPSGETITGAEFHRRARVTSGDD